MTTPFKSPRLGIAVMALSALGAAHGSTGELTNDVAGPAGALPGSASIPGNPCGSGEGSGTSGTTPTCISLVCDNSKVGPGPSLAKLTRHLMSPPSDEAALSAVCVALRDGSEVGELVTLLELCSNAQRGDSLPEHAMAELSFRIAKGATGAHARELCRTALDLCPVHVAALSLFEELADASWTDELCARYQIFLEDAPLHGVSPDICEAVTNKLWRLSATLEPSRASCPRSTASLNGSPPRS